MEAALDEYNAITNPVIYDNIVVGDYYADLLVEESILVELKAVKTINEITWLNA